MARVHDLGGVRLFDSYHCSRYNTNTGVLTTAMFEDVFAKVKEHLDVLSRKGEGRGARLAWEVRDRGAQGPTYPSRPRAGPTFARGRGRDHPGPSAPSPCRGSSPVP